MLEEKLQELREKYATKGDETENKKWYDVADEFDQLLSCICHKRKLRESCPLCGQKLYEGDHITTKPILKEIPVGTPVKIKTAENEIVGIVDKFDEEYIKVVYYKENEQKFKKFPIIAFLKNTQLEILK